MALEQHLAVVGERRDERRRHVGRRARELDPQRRALAGRLDHDRELEPLLDRRERLRRAQRPEGGLVEGVEVGRGDAAIAHRVLGQDLVGGSDARRHARARVGDPHHLEQLLHGSVLAVASVQRHERDLRRGTRRAGRQDRRRRRSGSRRGRAAPARPRRARRTSARPGARASARPSAPRRGSLAGLGALARQVQHLGELGLGFGLGGGRASRSVRRRARDVRAGQRAVQRDLLANDLADPADALADLVLVTPEKFSRIDDPPRPSTKAARPGTNATCSSSARASRSVVSM